MRQTQEVKERKELGCAVEVGKRNGKRKIDCGGLVTMRMEFRLDARAWDGDGRVWEKTVW